MGVGEIIALVIVAILIVTIACIIFTGTSDKRRRASERLKLKNLITIGSAFVFYGENGGGDPFTSEEHYIKVIDEKVGWVKLHEEIYSADRSKKPYVTTGSYKKDNFVEWILLHKDVQFYENINK
jgi:hypothetical protein